MLLGARIFVAVAFTILGATFIATTGALYYEFGYQAKSDAWISLATFYSHLFIFFPLFGVLALVAFYVPSCVFVDMYWRHVSWGKLRFTLGLLLVAAISVGAGWGLGGGQLRSIWEVKPEVLAEDPGDPPGCNSAQQSCLRIPVMTALSDVVARSKARAGMSQFVRNCEPDPLIETPPEQLSRRYCFATQTLVDAATCCQAQKQFGLAIRNMFEPEANRSLMVKVHKALLPFKIFFLLVVFLIAPLLAIRRRGIAENYGPWIIKIERGVLVGAVAMLFFPIMNLAFLQSSGLLYGTALDSVYRSISWPLMLTFGGWALLLLFFFFRDVDKDIETVARIAGVVGSALAVTKYQLIVDYAVRFMGSGASITTLGIIAALVGIAFLAIVLQPKLKRSKAKEVQEALETGS